MAMGLPRMGLRPTTTASLPAMGDAVAREQPHDAGRCGRTIGGLAHCHAAEAVAGDAVYVLFDRDAVEAVALVDLMGNRMLQQDAAHARVGVQVVDGGEELPCGRLFGQSDAERLHADAAAGIALHADVGCGCGIGSDQNGGENGRGRACLLYFLLAF